MSVDQPDDGDADSKSAVTGGLVLGKRTAYPRDYDPRLLHGVPRTDLRISNQTVASVPFYGIDLWHAYEVSWLTRTGQPAVAIGRIRIPADSPCMVESKSFKLYLNSHNQTRYASREALSDIIAKDLSAVCNAPVNVELLSISDDSLPNGKLTGFCLDTLEVMVDRYQRAPELLQLEPEGNSAEQRFYTDCFRSCCPVTAQPDWGSVLVVCKGASLNPQSLLRYLVSYREHQAFHESCVEQIFGDLQALCRPEYLKVEGHYLRRGGLDINPIRSTDPEEFPCTRLLRQ